jgi:hypothetical protein
MAECYNAEVSKIENFQQLKDVVKNPGSVTPAEWKTGMAVAETLFGEGKPIDTTGEDNVLAVKQSVPNKFDLGEDTTAEHLPHWGYVALQKGKQRELFTLNASRLPTEEVVRNVKDKIKEMKSK